MNVNDWKPWLRPQIVIALWKPLLNLPVQLLRSVLRMLSIREWLDGAKGETELLNGSTTLATRTEQVRLEVVHPCFLMQSKELLT